MQKNQLEIVKKLDQSVALVTASEAIVGFEKAYNVAIAIGQLKELLTNEYMKPIMALQGSRLGFKTDKDSKGGYPIEVVKQCLLDAVLMGLQPYNNEFNIIGGNTYATREGFGALLKKIKGLKEQITYKDVVIAADKQTATMTAVIKWSLNGHEEAVEVPFNIKSNEYASVDALIGKCERKARKWLYNKISGTDLQDADADDVVEVEIIKSEKIEVKDDDVLIARVKSGLTKINNVEDLNKFYKGIQEPTDTINELFKQKKEELNAAKTSKPNK
ncbi:hypothetical protein M2T79_09555 [Elizabethkingia miricola]|uniref:hypothetical protein n=1 Tax=Elizabethkingia miricola TaxID=172045 RepID=UPI002019C793|nr:hypothetical protein [Elizabethkingia miricola]MCL1656843.1 hypothetical protein [Elizabethkingia miricola]